MRSMALKMSLLSGFVAFVVATAVASVAGGKRLCTRIGLLTGVAVALSASLSGRRSHTQVEFENVATTD